VSTALLQHLRAQDAVLPLPEQPQHVFRDGVLLAGIAVVRVEQDVGVDEDLFSHERGL